MKRSCKAALIILIMIICSCLITSCNNINTFIETENDNINAETSMESDNIIDGGPVKGGTINLFSTYPDTLHPFLTKNPYLQNYFSFVFDSMVKLDKNQNPVGKLCDKWFVSEDGYTWTFHVREGIVWQDGYPLTAEDIKFTIESLISYKQDTAYWVNVDNISSVTIVDRNTVEITLKKPNAFTPELMTFPIISSRFYGNPENIDNAFNTKFPPGTGAYSFISYEENKTMVLTASRSWWERKLDNKVDSNHDNIETPYITDININFFKNTREALGAFQARIVDVLFVNENDIELFSGKTDTSSKKYINGKWDFLSFNLSNSVLSDKVVRQYISSCINQTKIVNEILPGRAVESSIPIIPGTWLYETEEWTETLNNLENNLKIINTKSKSLMLENDWNEYEGRLYKNVNGVLTPLKLELLVNDENSYRIKVAEKIAQDLNNNGIEVNVKIVKWQEMLNLIQSKKYDIAILGCTIPDYPDLSYIYSTSYSDYQKIAGTFGYQPAVNISGFYSEKVQELIEDIHKSGNRDEIKKMFIELRKIIADEVPCLGLYFYNNAIIYSKNVRGNIDPYIWDEHNNITEWYIAK